MAVALLGFTVAVPQDASLGLDTSLQDYVKPWRGGENVGDLDQVQLDDEDLGDLLDRLDGAGLDPDLAKNLDPAALAALLDGLSADELAALGLSAEEAAELAARLRDPDLTAEELAGIAAQLADRGLAFANADADGRFDPGEAAYADLDGDGKVSVGDLRLGVLALLLGYDRGLSDAARDRFAAYQAAGGVGLGRPGTAASRQGATAGTAPLLADGYPTDRAIGPLSVVCVLLYSPSLTCHTRTFVHGQVQRPAADGDGPGEGSLLWRLDDERLSIATDVLAAGPRATGTLPLTLQPGLWTPVPALTPGDILVDSNADEAGITLARDANGMVWAQGPAGAASLTVTWAVDLAYYDLPVAADVRPEDVPADQRPTLDGGAQAVGLGIAQLAGAVDRPYGDAVRAVAQFARGFGVGPLPDRDAVADDLQAVADARVGCARHRAEVFVLGVQALGIPARLVLNEAHAFAEAFVPKSGWHLVDVGACGQVEVRPVAGHAEVMAHQDLPYAHGDEPASQADADAPAASTTIAITEVPTTLRRNTDFTIAGQAASPNGTVPAGIPITFTYNRTKETPGTPFCSTQTDEGGAYRATCRLGPGTPAGSLQLVARLAPSVVADAPSAVSYSDPPFTVQKATRLTVLGPGNTSATVPSAYTAHALDEDGEPVPGRAIRLRVDDAEPLTRLTDATGRARFTLHLEPGAHLLNASLPGDDTYDPSAGTLAITAHPIFLAAQVSASGLEDGELLVEGALATTQGPQAGRRLTLAWANDPEGSQQVRSAVTGPDGRFTARFEDTPRPGPGLVSLLDATSGIGVHVAFARTVQVQAMLEVPERWASGAAVPVQVQVQGSDDPVPLRLLVDGLDVVDLAAGATQPGAALVTMAEGRHAVTLEAGEGVQLQAASASVELAPVTLSVTPPPRHAPGSIVHLTGTVTFGARGLDALVSARGAGATASGPSGRDGGFAFDFVLPDDAPPGNATLVLEVGQVGFQRELTLHIQRQANLAIAAPRLSFDALGATGIVVRGEGEVQVFADGRPLGPGGRLEMPSETWFLRRVHVTATVTPSTEGLSPATATATVTVANPFTFLAIPLAIALLALAGTQLSRAVRRRLAHRNRLLPPRPRTPVRVEQPALPRRVPLALDPAQDGALVVRLPRRNGWSVRDGRGRRVPCQVDGRLVRIPLDQLPPGPQRLGFDDGRGRAPLHLEVNVTDLRSALDEATLAILARLGRPAPWPAPLQAFEAAVQQAPTHAEDARGLRQAIEQALYATPQVDRPTFHAFFAAVDAAQARRQA